MPRTFDRRFQPKNDKDPNRFGTDFADPFGAIEESAQLAGSVIRDNLVYAIKESTGIDLTGVVEFMDFIVEQFGELLSLENWLEIIEQVIAFFADLLDLDNIGVDTFPILGDIINFFAELADRSGFLGMLNDVVEFFLGLLDPATFLSVLGDVVSFFTDLVDRSGFLEILAEVIEFLSDLGGAALTALLAFVGWLWNGVGGGFVGYGATVETLLKPLLEFLGWLWTEFGAVSETFLKPIFEFLEWLWTQFGATVESVLKPILLFLQTANLQALTGGILNSLWSLLNGGAEGIGRTLADVITSVGEFVEGLVPAITGVAGALSIGTLTTWAEGLLTKGLTWPDFKSIFGEIPESVLGVLPVANINLINPELMSQGGFDTTTTLAAGTGWAWDGTTTNSGSGGAARVTGNGTSLALYSNQSISVAPGDKLFVSCFVKSTGTVGAAAITLSLVEFSGTAIAATQSAGSAIASRAGSATFVQIGSTPSVGTAYTVPAGVSSVRVKVAVTAGAAVGSVVWFDDISVKKTGLMSGNFVNGVLGTVAQDIQAAIDQLVQGIKGTGGGSGSLVEGAAQSIRAALQSIFTTLFGPFISALPSNVALNPLLAVAIPGLSATKITSGSFGTGFITDAAITTAKIGPLAVTTAELGTDAVTNAKIGAGAVGTAEIASLAVTTALLNTDAVTNAKIATNAVTANEIANNTITANQIANSTITTTQFASATIPAIGTALGTAITTGSGAKQSRTNTATKITALAGDNKFAAFFVNPGGSISVDQQSADITIPANGRFTVTHAGYYVVELGFTVNASTPAFGFFNVAPAVFLNGSATPYKVGADSLGSFGGGFGNYSRSAHATFICYLGAAGFVEAGYRNFGVSNANFFQGDATGNTTFFSIAMLNRTAEG